LKTAELLASVQVVGSLMLLLGFPVFVGLGPDGVSLSESHFDALVSLGGVALGGLIATFVQAAASYQQARDRRLSLAHALFFRVQTIANEGGALTRHILNDAEEATEELELWRVLRPFPWFDRERVRFDPAELALFLRVEDQAFADKLINLASYYNLLAQLMEEYLSAKAEWLRIAEKEGSPEVDGEWSAHDTDLESKYPIQLGTIRQLAGELLRIAREGQPFIEEVVQEIAPKVASALDDERFTASLGPVRDRAA